MGGRIAQEKWETERSNRRESIRSINREQDGYYRKDRKEWRLCENCKKREDHCLYIKGQWLCMICRGEKYGSKE